MIRVGVTGGIGSGKSEFCRELARLGAYVVFADDLARELMASDHALIEAIKANFGEDSYTSEGNLNRAYLAEQAFQKGRVSVLNNLVHPVVASRIQVISEEAANAGYTMFVQEAALLLDHGRPKDVDVVVWIHASEDIRLQRAMQRDGAKPTQIRQRMNRQRSFDQVSSWVDVVIDNELDIANLQEKARSFYLKYTFSQ